MQTKASKCPYLDRESTALQDFADQTHAMIQDIEELVQLGRKTKTCAYYGSRHAIRDAQVMSIDSGFMYPLQSPCSKVCQRSTRH